MKNAVTLHNMPEQIDDTGKLKSFVEGSDDNGTFARIAWLLCDEIESRNSEVPLTGPESEAHHDQERATKRAQYFAALEHLIKALHEKS